MALQRKTGLGKGLGALLQSEDIQMPAQVSETNAVSKDTPGGTAGSINFIKIDHIAVNPFQPRTDFDEQALQELADSSTTQGLIQPITVRQLGKNDY